MAHEHYLGDGAYVKESYGEVFIYTSDGSPFYTNTVVLDNSSAKLLRIWLSNHLGENKNG